MEILNQLAVALGFATLAGLNLYLTVFITGMAIRNGWVELSSQYSQLEVLGGDTVLIASGIFFALEFFSDKIPWVDSLWDGVHTLIRPIGGGLLAIHTLGATDPGFEVVVGLLAGGATLATHGLKAGTRLVVNASPEPVSNIAVSLTEDAAVVGGLFLMNAHPLLAGAVFLAFLCLSLYLAPKLFRRSRAFFSLFLRKIGSWFRAADRDAEPRLYARLTAEEDLALSTALGAHAIEPAWAVEVIAGKSKGFRNLPSFTAGKLVAVSGDAENVHFVGRRAFRRRFHCVVPLAGLSIAHEPRFLSEDVVLYARDRSRRLVLKLPAGQGALAERVVESLLGLGATRGEAETAGAEDRPAVNATPRDPSAEIARAA
ncbi:MAG: DUF4126 domain-containing protein [Verrucomicrobiae bacterium]|nr:DUF4126 domain-containing protein [Verrucomicrobiae bacterium]MCP5550494.1 DUF4126 domain-containing protein [Akkermansiaceae bacterium]